jgi:hypothetical protein
MMTKKLALFLSLSLTLFLALFTPAQCFSFDRAHFKELNKKGRELAKQKNWPAMRQVLIEIGKEMPALTPIYTLRMASVETHLGNKSAALEWLERYAAMGLTYHVAGDDDLKPLLAEPGWKRIAAEMQQNATPVTQADPVCSLPIADLMPEDLTFDNSSGTFIFVSSVIAQSSKPSRCKPSKKCATSLHPRRTPARRSSQALADDGGIVRPDSQSHLDDRLGHARLHRLPKRR